MQYKLPPWMPVFEENSKQKITMMPIRVRPQTRYGGNNEEFLRQKLDHINS